MEGIAVLVYRDAAAADPDARHGDEPFDGIEILGIVDSQADADHMVDWHQRKYPLWKFLIEPIN